MPVLKNAKHERFANEFAKSGNATLAYKKVYKASKAVAGPNGFRLLKKDNVQARVAELQQKTEAATIMTLKEQLEYLTGAVRTPVGAIDENSPYAQAVEYEIARNSSKKRLRTLKIRSVDKVRALELAAKLSGFLRDGLEVKHTGSVQHEHKTGITVILPPAIATPRPIRQIEAHSEPPKPENPGQ